MKFRKVSDEHGGSYHMLETGDIEHTNPLDYYRSLFIQRQVYLMFEVARNSGFPYSFTEAEKTLIELANRNWDRKYQGYLKVEVPENLLTLLEGKLKKKDQEKLFRGFGFTVDLLTAFILKAGEWGYTFSQYRSQHYHNGLDTTSLPKVIHLEDGQLNIVGKTDLSEGQLKQVLNHRKVTVAKFIDRSDGWHCLFLTYDSIGGKETWNNNQPHYHYISDKWGITREKVLNELKSKTYSLPSLPHIAILDYGKQPG
ncbi:hypothetical protein [Rufibacter immobilis]|uniref:hypothetical protein n=1 Tax=Rufibacter immobilis TaxID=1348778 RepID=UPI0035F0E85E